MKYTLSLVLVLVSTISVAAPFECTTKLIGEGGAQARIGSGRLESSLVLSMGENASVQCYVVEDIIYCLAFETKTSSSSVSTRRFLGSVLVESNSKIFRLSVPFEWTSPDRTLNPFKSYMAQLECKKE